MPQSLSVYATFADQRFQSGTAGLVESGAGYFAEYGYVFEFSNLKMPAGPLDITFPTACNNAAPPAPNMMETPFQSMARAVKSLKFKS
jgi:hypothetical protein